MKLKVLNSGLTLFAMTLNFECVTAGAIFKDLETLEVTEVPYVVPLLQLLGKQSGQIINGNALLMTEERREVRCELALKGEDDPLEEFTDTALILPFGGKFGAKEMCGTTFGSWAGMEAMAKLCNKTNVVFTIYQTGIFPGLFAKTHHGDYFEQLIAKYGANLQECLILSFAVQTDEQYNFLFDRVKPLQVNLTIDSSEALFVYATPYVQFFFRVLLSSAASLTVLRAVQVIRERLKEKKMEAVHSFLLLSNLLLMVIVSILQGIGADFLTTNLSYHVHRDMYFAGTGLEVASHSVLGLMYFNLLQKTKFPGISGSLFSGRRLVYLVISALLCALDFGTVLISISEESTEYIYYAVPLVASFLEFVVLRFLAIQVKEMVFLLKEIDGTRVRGSNIPATVLLHLQLSFWIKCTVGFSFLATIARVLFVTGASLKSPLTFLLSAFLYKIGIIGGSLSQVESAKLPKRRLFHKILNTRSSVQPVKTESSPTDPNTTICEVGQTVR